MRNKFLKGKIKLTEELNEYQDIITKLFDGIGLNDKNHSYFEETLKSIGVIKDYDIDFSEILKYTGSEDDLHLQVMEMIEYVRNSGMIKQHQRGIKIDKVLK